MPSMTSRAMIDLRKMGYVPGIVEKFIRFPFPGHRVDLYGIIDVVAIHNAVKGVLGVQVTSGANVMSRVNKALESPHLALWLQSGSRFEVWGYSKKGERGKRKTWKLRREIAECAKDKVVFNRIDNVVAVGEA